MCSALWENGCGAGGMSGPKRKREIQLNFRVSSEELKLIEGKMAVLGIQNREASLRKMAEVLGSEKGGGFKDHCVCRQQA